MAQLRIKNEILEDQVLPLDGDAVVIGRGQDAQLVLQDKSISRFHARLEQDGADGARSGELRPGRRKLRPDGAGFSI